MAEPVLRISCDDCDRIDTTTVIAAEDAGWLVAEDEPDATERHGMCPDCVVAWDLS